MTTWLQHQEAIAQQKAFVAWCKTPPLQSTKHEDCDSGSDISDEELHVVHMQNFHPVSTSSHSYSVAKNPSSHTCSVPFLAQHYGATDFIQALNNFVQQNLPQSTVHPNIHDHFHIYNSIVVHLPSVPHVSDSKRSYRIRATLGHNSNPRKSPTPPHFDTVLVIRDIRKWKEEGLKGNAIHCWPCENTHGFKDCV
jgi:hypothetical protein